MFNRYLTGLFFIAAAFLIMPGCSDDDAEETGPRPEASFTASATDIEAGDTVTFEDTSTNNPSLWTWEFRGGEPLTAINKTPPLFIRVQESMLYT